ncbi:MAG: superoxide dismutase [Lachnospiraceae bacterium]|nr:superoxide dismutase [Lachnospiraceae bacterium]
MFKQIQLPYALDALEPYVDALTMETHYGKHHAAYTNTFNTLCEKAGITDWTVEEIFAKLSELPEDLRGPIRNNGGGYYNHNLYFSILAPGKGGRPTGALAAKIDETFGSFDEFVAKISAAATGRFGSGWAWLSADKAGNLEISSTPNQDNPLMEGRGFTPILPIDVWEHAYYLKYKNLRAEYVKQFFNVINWDAVAENYAKAMA